MAATVRPLIKCLHYYQKIISLPNRYNIVIRSRFGTFGSKMGSSVSEDKTWIEVDFEQVKEGVGKNSIYLLDVRNANERENPGRIPGSVHVPLTEMVQAFFTMSPEEFQAEYDFKRPETGFTKKQIVTYCKMGIRAEHGAEVLKQAGYENVAVYYGSFNDWISQNGKYIDGEIDKSRYISFEEMKNCLNDENYMVIDVRNPKERIKPGYIPGTKNIPLGEIYEAFGELSDQDFQEKYGFAKPKPSDSLALHCLKGKRAIDAGDKLSLLSYDNVKIYQGSLIDWKNKGGQIETTNEL